jgi:clan AA aspartic protease
LHCFKKLLILIEAMIMEGELMGLTHVTVKVANPADPTKSVEETFMVDSGAVYSLVPRRNLDQIGLVPHSKRTFILANGEKIERELGTAIFEYQGQRGDSLVIFGEDGDSPLLGSTTLEGFGLILDPFRRELKPLPMLLA